MQSGQLAFDMFTSIPIAWVEHAQRASCPHVADPSLPTAQEVPRPTLHTLHPSIPHPTPYTLNHPTHLATYVLHPTQPQALILVLEQNPSLTPESESPNAKTRKQILELEQVQASGGVSVLRFVKVIKPLRLLRLLRMLKLFNHKALRSAIPLQQSRNSSATPLQQSPAATPVLAFCRLMLGARGVLTHLRVVGGPQGAEGVGADGTRHDPAV